MDDFDRNIELREIGTAADIAEEEGYDRLEEQKFEYFIQYAIENEGIVRAALEELKAKRDEMDPAPPRNNNATAEMQEVPDDGFPRCVDESTRTPCSLPDLWNLYSSEYENGKPFPSVVVSGDIDSLYTFNRNLSGIVDACGIKALWTMPSILRRESADTGSRFCVNYDLCANKPFIRRGTAKTVPLNWFPNVKIATVQIGYPFCRELHIQLYFLGVEGFTSSSYFTTLQLGVINAMFNFAVLFLVNGDTDRSVKRELSRFYNLETLTGSRSWTGSRQPASNFLSPMAMKAIAEQAEVALDLIVDDDPLVSQLTDPFINGVQPENKRAKTLDKDEMLKFAKRLHKAKCFTASLAGCKGSFTASEFEEVLEFNPLDFRLGQDDSSQESGESSRPAPLHLSTNVGEDSGRRPPTDDIGLPNTVRPSSRSGEESSSASKSDSSEDSGSDSSNSNSTSDTDPIIICWETYCSHLNEGIVAARNDLSKRLHQAMTRALNANPDPSQAAKLHECSRWYVDKGYELAMDDPSLNLYSLIQPAEELLKAQLRER